METKRWELTVEEDTSTGELILVFPPEMLAEANWLEGDTIKWTENEDGSWTLTKDIPTQSE